MAISIPHRADPVVVRRAGARLRLGVLAAAIVAVAAGLFAVSRSSLFALRHVEVAGVGQRSAGEIRALAAIPQGTNVAWADTAAIEERLLTDPWIASATVTRSLPWTIDISVRQRTPVAVLDTGAGPGTLVAGDGTLLGPVGTAMNSPHLPSITAAPVEPSDVERPDVAGAVRALDALTPSMRRRVREVGVTIGGTLTLSLRGGTMVDLGSALNLGEKATTLRRVLAWARRANRTLESVSLVAPDAPAAVFGG